MIHDYSAECSISPLEWFCLPPTQTAVEKTYNVDYQPLTAIRHHAPIEFYIPSSVEEYLDLKNSRLHIKCRLVLLNGQACDANQVVAPVNDFFNSLWSNVECFLNDRLVSPVIILTVIPVSSAILFMILKKVFIPHVQ